MAQQEQQRKVIPFRPEFLEEIELDNFQIDGTKLLIRYEEPKAPMKTEGGVHLGETQEGEIRNSVLVKGEIVSVGTDVQNKNYKPGIEVFFYKAQSSGALRIGKNTPLFIYEEYAIYGHNKKKPVKVSAVVVGEA